MDKKHAYIHKIKKDRDDQEFFRATFPSQANALREDVWRSLTEHLSAVQKELGYEVQILSKDDDQFQFVVVAKPVSQVTVSIDVGARSFLIRRQKIKPRTRNFGPPQDERVLLDLDEHDDIFASAQGATLDADQIAELIVAPCLSSDLPAVRDLRPQRYSLAG